MERDVEVMIIDKAWNLEVTLDVRGGEDWKLKDIMRVQKTSANGKRELYARNTSVPPSHFCF